MFTVLHRFSHVEMVVALSPLCSTEGDQAYVHPIPTENKRCRSHPRIGIAVSIIPCVISISKSMSLLNPSMDGCLIWHCKIYARMLWLLHTWLYMFQISLFVFIFRPCINHKKIAMKHFISNFPKKRCAGPILSYGQKMKSQNIEGSKRWMVKPP